MADCKAMDSAENFPDLKEIDELIKLNHDFGHFGAPFREQKQLLAGQSLACIDQWEVIELGGTDHLRLLHSLTSQDLRELPPGSSRELLDLELSGHIAHSAFIGRDLENKSTFLLCEPGQGSSLQGYLKSRVFWLDVTFKLRPDLQVWGGIKEMPADNSAYLAALLTGTKADLINELYTDIQSQVKTLLGCFPLFVWMDPWPGICSGGTAYSEVDISHPGIENMAFLAVTKRINLTVNEFNLTANLAGWLAWDALRIARWRPSGCAAANIRALPAELDWLRTAVHLHKGCYRGQESVARVLNLGAPPRRLVFLHLDGSTGHLPQLGAKIWADGRPSGVITSVARHFELGPIALGLLKRQVPLKSQLLVEVLDENPDSQLDSDAQNKNHSSFISASAQTIVSLTGKAWDSPTVRPGQGVGVLPGAPRGRRKI